MNIGSKRLAKVFLIIGVCVVGYYAYDWYLRPYFQICNDEVGSYDAEDIQTQFIKSANGTIPIVLTNVHGGNFTSGCIRERTGGIDYNSIKSQDVNSIEFLLDLLTYIETQYNETPAYVYNTLHRKYIDLNRDPSVKNSYRDPRLEGYHDAFYNTIKSYIDQFSVCLVIDLHGFSSSSVPSKYRNIDVMIGTLEGKTLITSSKNQAYATLSQENVEIWPYQDGHDEYFSGDYNLKRFVGYEKYQGIQLELTSRIRMTDSSSYDGGLRAQVIANIAQFIMWWVQVYGLW